MDEGEAKGGPPPPRGEHEAEPLLASFDCSQRFRDCECATPGAVNLATAVVTTVAAGRYASAAITENGAVWGWGLLACGRPTGVPTHRPWAMEGLHGVRVVSATFGFVHLVLLAASGEVLTCNVGDDGFAGALPSTLFAAGQVQEIPPT